MQAPLLSSEVKREKQGLSSLKFKPLSQLIQVRFQIIDMKIVLASLLLVSLVLSSPFLANADGIAPRPITGPPSPSPCDAKCGERCKNAGVQDRCLKYCGLCCRKCSCVPSGTYGNKSECPCYRDMKNSKGKAKCP